MFCANLSIARETPKMGNERKAIVQTERLLLRQWLPDDRPQFAQLNADPEVMRYFPKAYTRLESDNAVDRFERSIEFRGWGFWAAERTDTDEFIGFIGMNYSASGLPFAPCVDIGWRLARKHWGQGFATEGAQATLKYAFEKVGLDQLVSMTPLTNRISERVMKKLGMFRADNFLHPQLAEGHILQEHVLYTITCEQWMRANSYMKSI
jgi:RimJ/RimL family protein N-acetyltransferase